MISPFPPKAIIESMYDWLSTYQNFKAVSRPTYGCFTYWPIILNNPPSALCTVQDITEHATKITDPQYQSVFTKFVKSIPKEVTTLEMVPRQILEIAKNSLDNLMNRASKAEGCIFKSVKLLNRASMISGIGIILITLGLLGAYFTKPTTSADSKTSTTDKNTLYYQIFYISSMVGLALVICSTYRVNSIASYLHNTLSYFPAEI